MSAAGLCLAMTLWAEARGESLQGQLYVADVVINRVAHEAFPDSVCGVTRQAGQFASGKGSGEDWRDIVALSEGIVSGTVALPESGATHFHTRAVNPYWADDFHHTATVGAHVFYSMTE